MAFGLAGAASHVAAQTAVTETSEELKQKAAPQARQTAPVISGWTSKRPTVCQGDRDGFDQDVDLVHIDYVDQDMQLLTGPLHDAVAKIQPDPTARHTLRDVCVLHESATKALRDKGYFATVVAVAPEAKAPAVLRFMVVAGRLTERPRVRVTKGDASKYRDRLNPMIEDIYKINPLNRFEVEKILLRMNAIPGLTVRLDLRSSPDRTPGNLTSELIVEVEPFKVSVDVNNYGSERLGREAASVTMVFNDPTGHGDIASLSVSNTADLKEQAIVSGRYAIGVGQSGDTLSVEALYAKSRPTIPGISIDSDTTLLQIEYNHPFIQRARRTLNLATGLELIDQTTDLRSGGRLPLNQDKTRAAYLKFVGQWLPERMLGSDDFGMQGEVELRQGLDFAGASKLGAQTGSGYFPSRQFGNPRAAVVRFHGDFKYGILQKNAKNGSDVHRFVVSARVLGQWSDKPLLTPDEFSVGNFSIGRGYDPSSATGDKAIGLRLEFRTRFKATGRDDGQGVYLFRDAVHIWNLDPGTTESDRRLASVGAGVRFNVGEGFKADITYAKALNRALSTDLRPPPARLLVSLHHRF